MSDRKRVLVAEDSSVIQNLTKKVLQFQNYDIESARDGQQVIDMLKRTDYDIILMDINMPKMNGMECSKEIRSMDNEKKSQVPIIAISGNARNYSEEDFQKAGMNEYIPKPINFDHLVEVVNKYTK
uniref:Response regulator n=1 Tax=Roseihalotalea indica TaxID=2867963 RepID=A0AA49GNQ5_9BACT|nr:response regulator [Tunicatimonas sp. TK19036]